MNHVIEMCGSNKELQDPGSVSRVIGFHVFDLQVIKDNDYMTVSINFFLNVIKNIIKRVFVAVIIYRLLSM